MKVSLVCFVLVCLASGSLATWLSEALHCQLYLQRDVEFNYITQVQTHNSFNNPGRGYTLAPNQYFNITYQLDLGVRGIEIDLHEISQLNPPVRVCHGSQDTYDSCKQTDFELCNFAGIEDYGPSTGCFAEALDFPTTLAEISTWLDNNPGEFIQVWMESVGNVPASTVNNAIAAAFPTGVFTPQNLADDGGVFPTPEDLFASDYQIFFAAKANTWGNTYVHNIEQWPGFPHKKIKYFRPTTCQSDDPSPPPTPVEFGLFYGDESALLGIIDGEADVGILDETNAPGLYDCGYSAAFDLVWTKKIKGAVWSWDKSKPTANSALNCAIMGSNNFWSDADCSQTLAYACQSDSDVYDWVVSTATGAWSSTGNCPTGYSFSAPHGSYQNAKLKKAKKASGETQIWLNLNDMTTEGTWTRNSGAETGNIRCISTGVADTEDIEPTVDLGGDIGSPSDDGVVMQISAAVTLIALVAVTFL